jgi:hypothetical protein
MTLSGSLIFKNMRGGHPFNDDLGPGGNQYVYWFTANLFKMLTEQAACSIKLQRRMMNSALCCHCSGGVKPDYEGNLKRFVLV